MLLSDNSDLFNETKIWSQRKNKYKLKGEWFGMTLYDNKNEEEEDSESNELETDESRDRDFKVKQHW